MLILWWLYIEILALFSLFSHSKFAFECGLGVGVLRFFEL